MVSFSRTNITLSIKGKRCPASASSPSAASADSPHAAATDLAELLVADGMPFRAAHAVVGALVRRSLDEGLPLADLVAAEPQLGERALELLEPGASVRRRTTPGGAGPGPVAVQRERLAEALATARRRCGSADADRALG